MLIKKTTENVGLDLTKEKGSDRIDLTKYGKDILNNSKY